MNKPPPVPESAGNTLAAVALFTTPPTDRALTGWCPADWIEWELEEISRWAG